MGKTRGHGSRPKAGGRRRQVEEEEESGEEKVQLGGQSANVGMLPPSDSDDEYGDAKPTPAKKAGQNPNAGLLPPSDSEEDEEEDANGDENEPPPAAAARRPKNGDEPDPEQIKKDLERLELIRVRREEQRLKRIKEEGWDRFAPPSETNVRPGTLPARGADSDDD